MFGFALRCRTEPLWCAYFLVWTNGISWQVHVLKVCLKQVHVLLFQVLIAGAGGRLLHNARNFLSEGTMVVCYIVLLGCGDWGLGTLSAGPDVQQGWCYRYA